MICPKCGSENVTVQIVTEHDLLDKKAGCLWWICVGWWWIPIKWIVFTLPALIVKILKPKKKALQNRHLSKCVCQNCGYMWDAQK